jgi:hypothetical protein
MLQCPYEKPCIQGVFGTMAFVLRKYAKTGTKLTEGRIFAPVAPGAVMSPQQPGQVPDVSGVPERGVLPVPIPEEGPRRPSTQYRTAQEIVNVFDATGKDVLDPERFEQFHVAPPSQEEQRKATPWKRKPARPQAGYALHTSGTRLSEQMNALAAEAEHSASFEKSGE